MTDRESTALDLRPDPVDLLDRRDPESVADALDLHVRLSALSGWVDDRKRDVGRWVRDLAVARKQEDGAVPKWQLPDGTVLLTDPEPKPRVDNDEAFARWFVQQVLGDDPDRDPDDALTWWGARRVTRDGEQWVEEAVMRRTVAEAHSADLLAFLDHVAHWRSDPKAPGGFAEVLADRIHVDVEWRVSDALLDDLIASKVGSPDGRKPRVVVVSAAGEWLVIDATTGERVPGTAVSAPSKATEQIRATPEVKERVRRELDDLLGPAALPS